MSQLQTQFAPAGRKDHDELINDYGLISSNQLTVSILNGIPTKILILNKERQVVFSNQAFLDYFRFEDITSILGMRPGEVIGCAYAMKGPDGCGTSKNCKVCGSVRSILSSLKTGAGSEEFTITGESNSMSHLKATSKIVNFGKREFILFSMEDISSEKKKALLERLFYHDILNTAHNINSMAELLSSGEYHEGREEYLGYLMKSTLAMVDEINTHRIISNDNQFDYFSTPSPVNSFLFFQDLKLEFGTIERGNQQIVLDPRSENFTFTVDKVLLKRVVTNMVKNALEAEQGKGVITMGLINLNEKGIMIWVHNPSSMSEDIQMQVFNRSFSTKGSDRGLGTYSMKILTEKFMKGKVSFTSSPINGTTFIIEIPGRDL